MQSSTISLVKAILRVATTALAMIVVAGGCRLVFAADAPLILSGTAWFGGNGVPVCSASTNPTCNGQAHVGGVVQNWWQCVELAQRFYNHMGWHSGVFNVSYAYQIYQNAASMGMTAYPNGGGYIPVPGDMIIHKSTEPYSQGAGHVSVVSSVSGSTVMAVEQNGSATGWATYTLSGSTLSRSPNGTVHIQGVVHDPSNSSGSGGSPNLVVTDGVWRYGSPVVGEYFDANYTVTNTGSAPAYLNQLYLGARGPNGQNVDLGGVWDTSPIMPGQSRFIYKTTSNFANDCPTCASGTYTVFASAQLPDGSWQSIPAASGSNSSISFNVAAPLLVVTAGIYPMASPSMGGFFDVQYTIKNQGSSSYNYLGQLLIAAKAPSGEVFTIGGDSNSAPIAAGASRTIFVSIPNFASNCGSCTAGGTYEIFARIQKSNGSIWNYPSSVGSAVNKTNISVANLQLAVIDGIWQSSNIHLGGYMDANYTVKNNSGHPFQLNQLKFHIIGPSGQNIYDLYGDANGATIPTGSQRWLGRATSNFGGSCQTCAAGAYQLIAQVELKNGVIWKLSSQGGSSQISLVVGAE